MNEATSTATYLGLPLMLCAALLMALRVALFARRKATWSSLGGGLAGLATVWLALSVVLERVWEVLQLPQDTLGDWPPLTTTIAAALALLAGAWLERRLREQELGVVLTGVLDGCTPGNAYEWAASIGFLGFAFALGLMLTDGGGLASTLGGALTGVGLAGAVGTGGGLLAAGTSALRARGPSTRTLLLLCVGLLWCVAMAGLAGRVETGTRTALEQHQALMQSLVEQPGRMLARDDLDPEQRARWVRAQAMWDYIETGVAGEYTDASGASVRFEPDEETRSFQQARALMPAMMRETADDAASFAALWPYVALAGLALGLVRPLRAARAPRAPTAAAAPGGPSAP